MKIGERRPPGRVIAPPSRPAAPLPPVPAARPASAPAPALAEVLPPKPVVAPVVPAPAPAPSPRKAPAASPGVRLILVIFLILLFAGAWLAGAWMKTWRPAEDPEKGRLQAALEKSRRDARELQEQLERAARELAELKAKPVEAPIEDPSGVNGRGRVTGKTHPPGGTITVLGTGSAKSGGVISEVKAGKRRYWVTLEGYETVEDEMLVDDQQTKDLGTINLTRRTGRLDVVTDATEAEFALQRVGPAELAEPMAMPIPPGVRDCLPGSYDLKVKSGAKEMKQRLEILPNMTTKVACVRKGDGALGLEVKSSLLTRSMAQEETEVKEPAATADGSGRLTVEEARLIKQGREANASGDFATATTCFERLLGMRPKSMIALHSLAYFRIGQKRFDEAEALLRRALAVDEGDAECLGALGRLLHSEGRTEEAWTLATQTLLRNPDNAAVQTLYGVMNLDRKQMATAEQAFLNAIKICSKDERSRQRNRSVLASAHFNLARCYMQQNPPSKDLARKAYNTSRELGYKPEPIFEEIFKN